MNKFMLAGAAALALSLQQVHADATWSQTTTTKTAGSDYESNSTERKVDENGNVVTKSSNYRENAPRGDASSSSSTTVEGPDGTKARVEEHSRSDDSGTTTEKHSTTTTTEHY
ncbi:MAG: hypothetical protein HY749_03900 [Gammaproteobacteria bacterium]|nr:hypothetical protein [Gammaproteobacteria bacterium]